MEEVRIVSPHRPTDDSTPAVTRRSFLRSGAIAGVAAGVAATPVAALASGQKHHRMGVFSLNVKPFELDEVTITELQAGMKSGKYTARSITQKYLGRIGEIDRQGPGINSVIEVNPDALKIAADLDRERKAKGPRGPLHGIPVLIKDNIGTADHLQTTAGSLALVGARPPRDSFVARKLREAGAVILGKTNLSEWANFRSNHSTSGWSGRGGLTHNPYALDRNPCGSSSGSGAGVSASLCAVAIGTETDGSIVCPSSLNGVAGIKPTVGLVSRSCIIPISHSQDTAGPMARTVTDAAILLGALTGVDPADPATAASQGKALNDYTKFLDSNGLKGAKIGVDRRSFGFNAKVDALMSQAIDVMKRQGATMVDPANLDSLKKLDGSENVVLQYEFKEDLNAYLASLGSASAVHTLEDLIKFNQAHASEEMPYFGQEIFIKSQARGPLTSKEYLDALEKNHRLTRAEGIDAVMDKFHLDALIAPTGAPAFTTDLVNGDHDTGGSSTAAAVAGYPDITVPAGFVFGLPVGISFFGRAWSEPTLIKLAYAFEQATKRRQPPKFLVTADLTP
ncbi:MAG: amidase [Terriglobia bacterium]